MRASGREFKEEEEGRESREREKEEGRERKKKEERVERERERKKKKEKKKRKKKSFHESFIHRLSGTKNVTKSVSVQSSILKDPVWYVVVVDSVQSSILKDPEWYVVVVDSLGFPGTEGFSIIPSNRWAFDQTHSTVSRSIKG